MKLCEICNAPFDDYGYCDCVSDETKDNLAVDEALLAQQKEIDKINAMTHEELARRWRYAPIGDDYFNEDLPYYEVFRARLYDHFGGFTPEISKAIGGRR